MKKAVLAALLLCLLWACQSKSGAPDVSSVKVNIDVLRFDKDLFAIDSNQVSAGLTRLQAKYGQFLPVFFGGVLGLPDSADLLEHETRRFISINRFIHDDVQKKYPDLKDVKDQLKQSFRFVKYYFPNYAVPNIITLVGPIDALAKMQNGDYSTDFLGPNFLGISLQFYLGDNYPLYKAQYFMDNVAPSYRSRRFDKPYIVADAMKLVVDDLFPEKSGGRALIEQVIEKGKQWWLLDKFMPTAADSVKTGFTQDQLKWCKENEGLIWNFFTTNENLETIEPSVIQNYIGESPTTQGMPTASPGNIGPWVGWQIVKKFAEQNSSLKLADVMNTPARKILTDAKYKPK